MMTAAEKPRGSRDGRRRRLHLRHRLGRLVSFRLLASLATALIVAGTTLVLSRVNEQYMVEVITQEAEGKLLLEARNLAAMSSDALLSEFPELTLVPLVRDLQTGQPELRQILVLDHAGRIQGGPEPRRVGEMYLPPENLAPLSGRILMNPGETLTGNHDLIQITAPVVHATEGDIGRIVVGFDRTSIHAKIVAARAAMIRTAAILLAAAVLLVTVTMTILFRPVGELEDGLKRIGRGDLDTPIRVRGTAELARLAQTLNEMNTRLKSSRQLAEEREEEIVATQREVIVTLGEVVESRSHETANHTRRVGTMSRELALLAGLPQEEAELIRMASPMHDIGKIGIPDSILNKPGKLTPSEYAAMQTHAEIGQKILAGSERPILKAAAIIAHEHHERWDGTGYPRGLVREEIHRYGRIVSLVDVFDALYSDRIYRKALSLEEVLATLRHERGRMFDPDLLDLVVDNIRHFQAICDRLSDKTEALHASAEPDPADIPASLTPAPRDTVCV